MTEVVKYGMDKQLAVSPEQMNLVKSTIFPNSSDDELKLYLFECQRRGVHPLDRKIHPIKRKVGDTGETRVSFQASIDLMRSEAEATKLYAGQDDPEYGAESQGFPESAKVTVYKWLIAPDGQYQRVGVAATARWKEYYPGEKLGHMWRKMPFLMLGKCAEALALRKAFPQQLSGLYAEEEMARPEGAVPASISDSVQAKPPAPLSPPPTKQEKASVNDTLKAELESYCGGDEAMMASVLKQISYFKKGSDEKWITDISKASNQWAGKSLGNLRALVEARENMPAGCTKIAKSCDFSSFSEIDGELIAFCHDGQKCRF